MFDDVQCYPHFRLGIAGGTSSKWGSTIQRNGDQSHAKPSEHRTSGGPVCRLIYLDTYELDPDAIAPADNSDSKKDSFK